MQAWQNASLATVGGTSASGIERRREPFLGDNVEQYNRAEETRLAVAYALGVEVIYRCRTLAAGGKGLDLACGPGLMSLWMAEFLKLDSLKGLDLSPSRVEKARENARERGVANVSFDVADVTSLQGYPDSSVDLCTFCDAAHHMVDPDAADDDPRSNDRDLEIVRQVLREMDRITKPDGLVVVMDLTRFRRRWTTEAYVALMGWDYWLRGLGAFYEEFRHSMFAAWSQDELATAAPADAKRRWSQVSPRTIKSVQFLIGSPHDQSGTWCRQGSPWTAGTRKPLQAPRLDWLLWRIGRIDLLNSRPWTVGLSSE